MVLFRKRNEVILNFFPLFFLKDSLEYLGIVLSEIFRRKTRLFWWKKKKKKNVLKTQFSAYMKFSAYMRRVAFIIISNKHTLFLLHLRISLIYVIMSVIKPHTAASNCMKIKGAFMTPADSLSQITIFQ